VKYYNDTPYGEAGIYWKNEEQQFLAELLVPVGCRATVYVPILKKKKITESGKQISTSAEIRFLREEEGYRLFTVESGQYQFLSE
jgi:alpha-L-rhamnosidase